MQEARKIRSKATGEGDEGTEVDSDGSRVGVGRGRRCGVQVWRREVLMADHVEIGDDDSTHTTEPEGIV